MVSRKKKMDSDALIDWLRTHNQMHQLASLAAYNHNQICARLFLVRSSFTDRDENGNYEVEFKGKSVLLLPKYTPEGSGIYPNGWENILWSEYYSSSDENYYETDDLLIGLEFWKEDEPMEYGSFAYEPGDMQDKILESLCRSVIEMYGVRNLEGLDIALMLAESGLKFDLFTSGHESYSLKDIYQHIIPPVDTLDVDAILSSEEESCHAEYREKEAATLRYTLKAYPKGYGRSNYETFKVSGKTILHDLVSSILSDFGEEVYFHFYQVCPTNRPYERGNLEWTPASHSGPTEDITLQEMGFQKGHTFGILHDYRRDVYIVVKVLDIEESEEDYEFVNGKGTVF